MDIKIKSYVNEVLSFITADEKTKNRISKDLYSHIYEASQNDDLDWVLNDMGNPQDVALDFMENLNLKDANIKTNRNCSNCENKIYEYKSKITVCGLPLIHIKLRNKYRLGLNLKLTRAKGIIAIGDIATGILFGSGIISTGLLSFGVISIGLLLSFGALSIGGLSFGAISIGGLAIGGLAIGIEAIGGLAIAKNVAIGGGAIGTTVIGDGIKGTNTLHGQNFNPSDIKIFLESCDPGKDSLILKLINLFL